MTREEEIKKAAKDNEPRMIKDGGNPRDFLGWVQIGLTRTHTG